MGSIPVSGSWRVQSGPCRSTHRTKLAPRNLPFWNIPDQNWQTTELESWTTYWFISIQELELELELERQLVDWELGEHMLCGAPNCNRIPRSLLSQRWNANKYKVKIFISASPRNPSHPPQFESSVLFPAAGVLSLSYLVEMPIATPLRYSGVRTCRSVNIHLFPGWWLLYSVTISE